MLRSILANDYINYGFPKHPLNFCDAKPFWLLAVKAPITALPACFCARSLLAMLALALRAYPEGVPDLHICVMNKLPQVKPAGGAGGRLRALGRSGPAPGVPGGIGGGGVVVPGPDPDRQVRQALGSCPGARKTPRQLIDFQSLQYE